jgi:hemerythrin-like domain-containing protein
MNTPTDKLEVEHRVIAKIILVVSMMADQLDAGQSVNVEILQRIVEFMRIYVDQFHHGKEEQLLFPLLVRRGVPTRGCPIEALTHEHVIGKELVAGLSEAILGYQKYGPVAEDTLVKSLRGLADLYTNHIWKENYLLFPMTNKILGSDDLNALSREFEKMEREFTPALHESLERFADGLYVNLILAQTSGSFQVT